MTDLTLGQTSCLVLLKSHFSHVVEPLFSSGRGSTAFRKWLYESVRVAL